MQIFTESHCESPRVCRRDSRFLFNERFQILHRRPCLLDRLLGERIIMFGDSGEFEATCSLSVSVRVCVMASRLFVVKVQARFRDAQVQ